MSKNFNYSDIMLLTELVNKYQNVVECKRTNAYNNYKKEETWLAITNEFNSVCSGIKRTTEQLKNKYKHIKQEAQKKIAKDKLNLFKTGGGMSETSATPLDERIQAMNVLISPIANNTFDSDYSNNYIADVIIENVEDINKENQNSDIPNTSITEEINTPNKTMETPQTSCSVISPKKKFRGLKRKQNSSVRASEALTETTKARKECCEAESRQLCHHRNEQQNMLKAEHTKKMEIYALKLDVLKEKFLYFKNLNKTLPPAE